MSNYITTNNAERKAVFTDKIPEKRHKLSAPNLDIEFIYTTHKSIPDLSTEADIDQFAIDRLNGLGPKGAMPAEGAALAVLTWKGDALAPWHRIMTVDCLYLVEGIMELELDGGEKRIMHPGDSLVGRATMHTGRNITPNGGIMKLLGFSLPVVTPVKVGGHELGAEWIER
jgi:quercetin dioxygenase-like cupin family protein